ncbi:zeta toxin family protein [Cytobacillus sp. FSL R5-0569]|uniref:zeta toxin family protein n=1 Tax=Cytobacillus TaxID=2675230 RepID=UPI002787F7A6|nr:zeta toxin family protein [Cytobacillus kochii]MDQ0185851.1 putative ABC-type ATPase [Cytobacillus kochii]
MTATKPIMYVISGENGAGKSTFRDLYLVNFGIAVHIETDMLERKYEICEIPAAKQKAEEEADTLIHHCIKNRIDFSLTSPLSAQTLDYIHQAKRNGFQIAMIYIGINDVTVNLLRINLRAEQGEGNRTTIEEVEQSRQQGAENFQRVAPLIDSLVLLDNSSLTAIVIAKYHEGNLKILTKRIPQWTQPYIQALS